jgi:prevent-host-death family protein
MKPRAKTVWQVQEAKTHLSEVIERAADSGPQVITRHGKECGAVISMEDLTNYRELRASKPSFLEAILAGPRMDNDLVDEIFKRSQDTPRDIDMSDFVFDK